MCNLSDVILENGLKEGIEQGIEAFIVDKIEDGVEKATIIEKLVKRFKITREKAEEYYNRFSAGLTDYTSKWYSLFNYKEL